MKIYNIISFFAITAIISCASSKDISEEYKYIESDSYDYTGKIVKNEAQQGNFIKVSKQNESFSCDFLGKSKVKKKDKVETKKIAKLWLAKKSDSLNIPQLELSDLSYNPDEATMALCDKCEETKHKLSENKKNELINEIKKSGFYFIDGIYLNKKTNKKHTITFAYNYDKKISYVYINEVENEDNYYYENLVNWDENK